jgi:very-short-patch-repair endonuclease
MNERPETELPPYAPYPPEEIGSFEPFLSHLRLRCDLTKVCESPIEIDLGAALIPLLDFETHLIPQFVVGRCRFDFAVTRDGCPLLLIECDGAAFHSSPEQKANDAATDQAADDRGIPLLRLTGKDIYRDPNEAALQAARIVRP